MSKTIETLEKIEAEIHNIQTRLSEFRTVNELIKTAKAQHSSEIMQTQLDVLEKSKSLVALITAKAGGVIVKNDMIKKTPIHDWVERNDCSVRLTNVLLKIKSTGIAEYIEDIELNTIISMKNAGKRTWREFEEIRRGK